MRENEGERVTNEELAEVVRRLEKDEPLARSFGDVVRLAKRMAPDLLALRVAGAAMWQAWSSETGEACQEAALQLRSLCSDGPTDLVLVRRAEIEKLRAFDTAANEWEEVIAGLKAENARLRAIETRPASVAQVASRALDRLSAAVKSGHSYGDNGLRKRVAVPVEDIATVLSLLDSVSPVKPAATSATELLHDDSPDAPQVPKTSHPLLYPDLAHWIPLFELRPGAIFETRSGVRAVKSDYVLTYNGPVQCVLLNSGEYAHFGDTPSEHDATEVYELHCCRTNGAHRSVAYCPTVEQATTSPLCATLAAQGAFEREAIEFLFQRERTLQVNEKKALDIGDAWKALAKAQASAFASTNSLDSLRVDRANLKLRTFGIDPEAP